MQPQFPPAPWTLTGRAALLPASWRELRLLVAYADSPVGPYLEHAVLRVNLSGPSVVQMSVDSSESMRGGIANWGYPKTLEKLWHRFDGTHFVLGREASAQTFHLRCFGPSFPVNATFFSVQTLHNASVRVPGQIRSTARIAFRGKQLALVLQNFVLTIEAPQPLN